MIVAPVVIIPDWNDWFAPQSPPPTLGEFEPSSGGGGLPSWAEPFTGGSAGGGITFPDWVYGSSDYDPSTGLYRSTGTEFPPINYVSPDWGLFPAGPDPELGPPGNFIPEPVETTPGAPSAPAPNSSVLIFAALGLLLLLGRK